MYTKCVCIVPVSGVDAELPWKLKKVTGVGRGTLYTKCVYIVPVHGVPAALLLKLKKGYWYCKRNGVYKMCIHRSSFWSI